MMEGIREFCERYPAPKLDQLRAQPIATFDCDEKAPEANIRYSAHQPIEDIGAASVQTFLELNDSASKKPVIKILPARIS